MLEVVVLLRPLNVTARDNVDDHIDPLNMYVSLNCPCLAFNIHVSTNATLVGAADVFML